MPPPQIFSTTGHAYGLTVAGVQIIDHCPTDVAPIRFEAAGEMSVGGIAFVVDDDGTIGLPDGHEVRLTDNRTNTLLAAGVLVGRRMRRQAGSRSFVACEAVGYGWFLDRRYVPFFNGVEMGGSTSL